MEPPEAHEFTRVIVQPDGMVQLELLGPDQQVAVAVTMTPVAARDLGETLFKAGSERL